VANEARLNSAVGNVMRRVYHLIFVFSSLRSAHHSLIDVSDSADTQMATYATCLCSWHRFRLQCHHRRHHVVFIGPILWGHSGPLCHALSLLSSSSLLLWTSMRRRLATVATPGEWQCGVRRLAVANGPNIFQMLFVYIYPL